MQHRELELFLDLTRTLHFGESSNNCNISPSALSRAIQRLEGELGVQLFVRDNRSVQLTEAGRRLRQYALETVDRWRELLDELHAEDSAPAGEIEIYASVTACYSILPGILQDFRERFPGVSVNLKTGDPASALERVEHEEADVAVAALPDSVPQALVTQLMTTTPLVCVGPVMRCEVSDEIDREEIRWERVPFVLSERGLARQRIDEWFRRRQIRPRLYGQVSGNEAILAMVSLGCGVGIVPGLVLEKSPLKEQVRVIEGGPKLRPYRVGFVSRRKRLQSPIVRAFWSTVTKEIPKEIPEEG